MAVVDRNSNVIANVVAVPPVANDVNKGASGSLCEVAGTITTAADDTANSIGRFVRVPSNARISQVLLSTSAAASTAGAVDIGVYKTAANGSTVVDADLFGSAVALTSTQKQNLDVTYESGEYTMAESVKPLWEVLGLSSDPNTEYDIAYTITTTFNGGPTAMNLKVRYAV